MDALILSCGTGGGHNAAAEAIREEFERRGDHAVVMDPYSLRGEGTVRRVNGAYVSLAQRAPRGFGVVYGLGQVYRKLPWRSPVYHINRKAAQAMGGFLAENHFDAVVMTHLYPAEIMTLLKAQGVALPATVFVATDYACTPFTEETECDAYVIPHPGLFAEFEARGIPAEKLHPLGIPVRSAFLKGESKAEARSALGLKQDETYLLAAGGSMGAGILKKAVDRLYDKWGDSVKIIVVCGTNHSLYDSLKKKYGHRLILLHSTGRMALYLRACDLYLTKPGGLSSTEAAVAGVALVHLPPIPGCETQNARFFARRGLSIPIEEAAKGPEAWRRTVRRQRDTIPGDAAQRICQLARELAEEKAKAEKT